MKIVRKGRQYDYDYKFLHLQATTHKKLKELSLQEGVSMGGMIDKMIEVWN